MLQSVYPGFGDDWAQRQQRHAAAWLEAWRRFDALAAWRVGLPSGSLIIMTEYVRLCGGLPHQPWYERHKLC